MNNPLVTVCIPAYNCEKTIAETIRSLLNQTYPNIQIHVVDNASTDRTCEIVESFGNNVIVIHRREITGSGEENFTRCMHIGDGKYRAIYHSDDIYHPEMIAKAVETLEQYSDVSAVSTRALFMNPHGERVGASKTFKQLGLPEGEMQKLSAASLLQLVLCHYNFLICPSLIARADVLTKLESFREDLFGTSADLDVWMRLSEHSSIALLAQPLITYRLKQSPGDYQYRWFKGKLPDIFKVLEFWLDQPAVKSKLSLNDFVRFKKLKFRDLIKYSSYALLDHDANAAREFLDRADTINLQVPFCFSERKDYQYFILKIFVLLGLQLYFGRFFKPLVRFFQP